VVLLVILAGFSWEFVSHFGQMPKQYSKTGHCRFFQILTHVFAIHVHLQISRFTA
jgi:hypothetical protein